MPLWLIIAVREIRRGVLATLLVSTFLSALILTAVAGLGSRIETTVLVSAASSFAADVVVQSSEGEVLDLRLASELEQSIPEVESTNSVEFQSMLFSEAYQHLVSVKAVGDRYPLRGEILVAEEAFGPDFPLPNGPLPGNIWLESRLYDLLQVQNGDTVELGDATLTVERVLIREPDRISSFGGYSPRVLIAEADLEKTQVLVAGSRARWRKMYALDIANAPLLEDYLSGIVKPGQTVLSPRLSENETDTQSNRVRNTLNNTRASLLIGTCGTILLALIAAGLAASNYIRTSVSQFATLRSFGVSARLTSTFYLKILGVILFPAILLGMIVGWVLQEGIVQWMSAAYHMEIYGSATTGFILAGVLTLCSLATVMLPAFVLLLRTPVQSILRNPGIQNTLLWWRWLPLLVLFMLSVALYTQNLLLTSYLMLGGVMCALISWGMTRLIRMIATAFVRRSKGVTRLVAGSLVTRNKGLASQMLTLSLIILPALIYGGLVDTINRDWQLTFPEQTPNHLLANVLPEQIDPIESQLQVMGSKVENAMPLYRASLLEPYDPKRTEVNFSVADELPESNELVDGQWWTADSLAANPLQASLEDDFADENNLDIGDWVTVSRDGIELHLKVTSLRKVNWTSMSPNFFIMVPPKAVADLEATWLLTFLLTKENKKRLRELSLNFPTIHLYEFDQVLIEVRNVIGQLSQLLLLVYVLTVIAAIVILVEIVRQEVSFRKFEWSILKVFGIGSKSISKMVIYELMLVGLCAGLVAALSSQFVLYGVVDESLGLSFSVTPLQFGIGALMGVVFTFFSTGWLAKPALKVNAVSELRSQSL